jgi:signal transduction histidine kinase
MPSALTIERSQAAEPVALPDAASGRRVRRFRSFKTKLTLLVALAVVVPSLFACLILGGQLDGQTRSIFASNLAAQLETFSLILQDSEDSLAKGVTRTAADNTLQVTLDLGIASQLTRYLDQQRKVLDVDFVAAYQLDSRLTSFSAEADQPGRGQWRLAGSADTAGTDCAVARQPLTIAICDGVAYLVSLQPVERRRDAGRGDATAAGPGAERLGYLLGGVRVAGPALIAALQQRRIPHPVIWSGDWVVYSDLPVETPLAAGTADEPARQYRIDKAAYLGAAKTIGIGGQSLTYGVLVPLDPLRSALAKSVLTVAGFGLLLAVITLIALSFIANRIARPIQLLREGAAQIGSGVLDYHISVSTGDELEGLAEQFNQMAAQLRASYAELERKVEERTAELLITFENMGDGVVMFDANLRLAAWNRNFQQIIDLPDVFLADRPSYADYIRYLAERGEFGAVDVEAELRRYAENAARQSTLERVRPDARVIEVRHNPVPGGGFVLIYADITERKRSEAQVRTARDTAEAALRELKAAQANLIQAEKMASLGQLTAGIAHEIKNPLNFVNNFADLSVELLDELKAAAGPAIAGLGEAARAEIDETVEMLTTNLEKIAEHGRRADGIVKSMLEHSRGGTGERRSVDLNALVEEALNLAYHGARAQDQSFNITLERDFGQAIAPIELVPQDVTRVFLNLVGNGFYAANKRRQAADDATFKPMLKVSTRELGDAVEVRVRDNGTGIVPGLREKLFQPFFTTKPTGEGTGLGLSISYDIVTQEHGGTITVDSQVGEFTEFTVRLPRDRPVTSTSAAA